MSCGKGRYIISVIRNHALQAVTGLLCLSLILVGQSLPPRRIAFATEFDGRLRVVDYNTGKVSVTDLGLDQLGDIAYCPEEDLLAFDGEPADKELHGLYLLHMSGGRKEPIQEATAGENYYRPVFDRGCHYLYAPNISIGLGRYSLSTRKWERVRISPDVPIVQQVTFSRSGQQVALSPEKFNGFLIASNENEKLAVRRRVLTEFRSCASPAWIGDDSLVFSGSRPQDDYVFLWRYDLATHNLRQLTHAPLGARGFLSLSADEKTIVFTAGRGASADWKLWTISIDGTGLRQITHGGQESSHLSPVWLD